MKKHLLFTALVLINLIAMGQTKNNKYNITIGGAIQHYNGNLGNSFFKFNTTCFAGLTTNFGVYLNKSFDFNVGGYVGQFGYCQTESDQTRVVSTSQRCSGCKDLIGMGELRSLMVSGNVAIKYKFANGNILKENSKFAPYIYVGLGVNYLSDNMKRQCVNVGTHITINSGVGIIYNINERLNIGYNLGVGSFISKKVYNTNGIAEEANDMDADDLKMEKRKDLFMQNALTIGINF